MQNFGIAFWENPFDEEKGLSIGPIIFGLQTPLSTADGNKVQFMSSAPTPHKLLTAFLQPTDTAKPLLRHWPMGLQLELTG